MDSAKLIFALAISSIAGCTTMSPVPVSPDQQSVQEVVPFDQWTKLIKERNFSGAIAVTHNGEIIFSMANGYADRDTSRPNSVDTRFGLASTGKLLTSIATMQLVEKGKIELDDVIGTYIPDYENRTVREQATVRHLLKMQSGLGDIFTVEYERSKKDLKTHADYVRLFEHEPPAFVPGTDRAYSNAGFILLGRIIEVASGEDYYSYMQQHVFEPAGMANSGFAPLEQNENKHAIGYRVAGLDGIAESTEQLAGRKLVANTDLFAAKGTAAGGGFSTVPDFVKLDNALRKDSLISSRSLSEIFGEGFVNGSRGAGIAGGAPGASTRYRLLPNGYSIIAFGNLDLPSAPDIVKLIEDSLGRQE